MDQAKNVMSWHIDNSGETQTEDGLAHLARFHLRNVSRAEKHRHWHLTNQVVIISGATSFFY